MKRHATAAGGKLLGAVEPPAAEDMVAGEHPRTVDAGPLNCSFEEKLGPLDAPILRRVEAAGPLSPRLQGELSGQHWPISTHGQQYLPTYWLSQVEWWAIVVCCCVLSPSTFQGSIPQRTITRHNGQPLQMQQSSGLAVAAGLFLAAEGVADLGAGGADIDVGDAAVRARFEIGRVTAFQDFARAVLVPAGSRERPDPQSRGDSHNPPKEGAPPHRGAPGPRGILREYFSSRPSAGRV